MYPIRFLTREEAEHFIKKLSVYPSVVELFTNKLDLLPIYIPQVTFVQGNIIKQEALSVGMDAALPKGMIDASVKKGPILIIGDRRRIKKLIEKLKCQPYGIKQIAEQIEEMVGTLPARHFAIPSAGVRFDCNNPVVMGILNVTPDSFSDGGKFNRVDSAVRHAEEMVEEGADIIDIGGESTRPGAQPVSAEEEIERVIPVIREVKKRLNTIISIDTYKAEVAKAAIEEGADIINDVSAARSREMEELILTRKLPVILMHMKGRPRDMQKDPRYDDVVDEIYTFLKERVDFFADNGLPREQMAIDPGIGFGKTLNHNLTILNHLDSFSTIGTPILIGPSRKSFIGMILDLPVEERLEGTISSVVWSYLKGACIFRVHDVKANKRALDVARAIKFSFEGEAGN